MSDQITSPRRSLLSVGIFIAILGGLFGVWILAFWNILPSQKAAAREIVTNAFKSIRLGTPETDALTALIPFARGRGFKVSQHQAKDGYIQLMTPPELGTLNWLMIVDVRDGRVAAKRVRVLEGNYRPCDAPADEGTPTSPPERINEKGCL